MSADCKYLSPKQAAEKSGLSVETIRRRIADGTLPASRVGRLIRIRAEDLEAMHSPMNQWAR